MLLIINTMTVAYLVLKIEFYQRIVFICIPILPTFLE